MSRQSLWSQMAAAFSFCVLTPNHLSLHRDPANGRRPVAGPSPGLYCPSGSGDLVPLSEDRACSLGAVLRWSPRGQ